MNSLHLHGALAQFGGPYNLDAQTPRELVRALSVQIDGFEEAIAAGKFHVTRVFNGTVLEIDEDLVLLGMENAELHITPVLEGAKGKGVGKILVGIALIGAAVFIPGAGAVIGAIGLNASTVIAFGAMMVFGGLSMMLAPSPKGANPNDGEKEKASFIFNGPVNVTEQGHPVPLVYGRYLTGSVVISSDLISDVYVAAGVNYNGVPDFTGYKSTGNGGVGGTGSDVNMFPSYPGSARSIDSIMRVNQL